MEQRPEQAVRQENLEIIQRFRLLDDTFFAACLQDNPACAEFMLRILLDKKDLRVLQVHTQYSIYNLQGHSAVLDALATDSEGRQYNIEIQRRDADAVAQRARYYSSLMDGGLLEKGKDYAALPDTYVIFITEHDVLAGGLPLYHIERRILEMERNFGDGAHIVYVNAAYVGDSDVGRLIHDLLCADPHQMYYPLLAEVTGRWKREERKVEHMCQILDEVRAQEQAKAAVRMRQMEERFKEEMAAVQMQFLNEQLALEAKRLKEQAAAEEQAAHRAIRMLRDGLTVEKTAEYTGLPVEKVQELADLLTD